MNLKEGFLKLRNTNYIYIILIIGAALMIFSSGAGGKEEQKEEKVTATKLSDEDRLKTILSQIEGVGEASVMVTYYESAKQELAYEKKTDKKGETSNGFGGESSDEKAVMSDGEPVILKEIYPQVKGVIVVADGAKSSSVREAITEAVSTSLGIAVHRICVLPKSG